MNTVLDLNKIEKVAHVLKALGNPIRIRILDLLRHQGELSVSQIGTQIDAEQSLVSHNLANLKTNGVLQSRREGKNIFYSLKMKEVIKVLECMEQCDI